MPEQRKGLLVLILRSAPLPVHAHGSAAPYSRQTRKATEDYGTHSLIMYCKDERGDSVTKEEQYVFPQPGFLRPERFIFVSLLTLESLCNDAKSLCYIAHTLVISTGQNIPRHACGGFLSQNATICMTNEHKLQQFISPWK